MSAERIPSETVRSTIQDEGVQALFNSVLRTPGGKNRALHVIHPKMRDLGRAIDRFLKVLELLGGPGPLHAFAAARDATARCAAQLRAQLAELPKAPDLDRLLGRDLLLRAQAGDETAFDGLRPADTAAFEAAYKGLKRCNPVNVAIVTCDRLKQHRNALQDGKALKDGFLRKMVTIPLTPLPDLPALDFRLFYNSPLVDSAGRLVLLGALHKLLDLGHQVYELVTSPDIDVNDFVQVVMESIEALRKRLPRCDAAFDKIQDSVALLKARFGKYHKDAEASGSSTIIMENFVLDVASETKHDPTTARQFGMIIKHYQKEASGQKDPRLQSVFKAIKANIRVAGADVDADEKPGAEDRPSAEPSAVGPAGLGAAGPAGEPARATPETKQGPSAKTLRTRRKRARARGGLRDQAGASPPARAGLESGQSSAALGPPPATPGVAEVAA